MKLIFAFSVLFVSLPTFAQGKISRECLNMVSEKIVEKLQAEEPSAELIITRGKNSKVIGLFDEAQIFEDLALMPIKKNGGGVATVAFESNKLIVRAEVQARNCQILSIDMGQNDLD